MAASINFLFLPWFLLKSDIEKEYFITIKKRVNLCLVFLVIVTFSVQNLV
jgi:hypothetical protein